METKFTIEGYWNEWGSKLLPWLLTHGLRVLFIIAAAYVIYYIARRVIEKIVRVSVTADRHQWEIAERKREDAADPLWKEFIIKPPQFLRVDDFLESGVVLKILGETVALKQWEITGELRKRIKVSFEQEGIEMPTLQRFMNPLQDSGL